jgi:DNA-binding NtrC family response regulator
MLHARGHVVTGVDSAGQARAALEGLDAADLVIVLDLADPKALKFLRDSTVKGGGIPVVCIRDRRKPEASTEALRLGIADLLDRPVTHDDLVAAIANARDLSRIAGTAKREPAPTLELPADSVFGASPAIREILALVRRIAPTRANVLLLGERGTGREMVARAVHAQSPRRNQPFVRVSCGAPSSSELADVLEGRVEAGATVFFENIQELGDEEQRTLAEVIGRRDGHGQANAAPRGLDVRYIGSTPPRVADWVDRGDIRSDLVEALGVVRIELPPLRQRMDDVPLLATQFLKEACRRNGVPSKTFTRSALVLLAALPWPGNAGELRALTERLAVVITRGVVLMEDVLAHVRLDGAEAMGGPRGTLKEARERFERDYVASVLLHHRGRMGAAARELGIERTNLYRKIKQLNIRWTAGTE